MNNPKPSNKSLFKEAEKLKYDLKQNLHNDSRNINCSKNKCETAKPQQHPHK